MISKSGEVKKDKFGGLCISIEEMIKCIETVAWRTYRAGST
jgi:hypothetical protein